MTHAGIDGFSRLIVYVLQTKFPLYCHFQEAVERYGLPSRVSSDQGTENCAVARSYYGHVVLEVV